jgi:hypothetical protein
MRRGYMFGRSDRTPIVALTLLEEQAWTIRKVKERLYRGSTSSLVRNALIQRIKQPFMKRVDEVKSKIHA